MANYKVTDTQLTAIANAIRANDKIILPEKGSTWVFKNSVDLSEVGGSSVASESGDLFVCDNVEYMSMDLGYDGDIVYVRYSGGQFIEETVYENGAWTNSKYKTIRFLNNMGDFEDWYAWFAANATSADYRNATLKFPDDFVKAIQLAGYDPEEE